MFLSTTTKLKFLKAVKWKMASNLIRLKVYIYKCAAQTTTKFNGSTS